MNRRTLLRLSLVTALLLVTTWLSQRETQPEAEPGQVGVPITTYFIRGLDGTITNTDGLPSHRLKSDSLRHFADSDLAELKQPQLTIFLPKGEQWQVVAAEGQLDAKSNQITLEGKVILNQLSGNQPIKVETERLQLHPDTRYGESDTLVSISSPGGHISGVGMQLFGEEHRLLLLSEVRGNYDTTVR